MKWPVKISLGFVVIIAVVSLLAPWIAPYDYDLQDVAGAFVGPSHHHFFGTDALGRDLFSRLVYGCRVSMSVALFTAVSSVLIGVFVGTIAGYVGGWIDRTIMRFIDILYTLPSLIIMILVMLIFGRGLLGIFIALTATGWLGTARLVRAQILSWKGRPFVEAARSLGVPSLQLIWKHILPNCMGPVIVELSYQIPTNVLAEAFLSFLGVGLRPPMPSWGILADEGWRALQIYPYLTIFPGLAIFLTMLSFNILGDHLRDKLDPMLRGR
ncbi:MAG: ABC transporter permease [Bdellovibrionales bacterium]|nr:ABC transporter permease [Bdellovibrionales bacterium]